MRAYTTTHTDDGRKIETFLPGKRDEYAASFLKLSAPMTFGEIMSSCELSSIIVRSQDGYFEVPQHEFASLKNQTLDLSWPDKIEVKVKWKGELHPSVKGFICTKEAKDGSGIYVTAYAEKENGTHGPDQLFVLDVEFD